jgi:hypothetical protein
VPPAKDWVDENVAPAGRPVAVSVTVFDPSVALTTKRTVDPAVTVCAPGMDNVGGELTVSGSQTEVAPILFESPE